MGIAGRSLRGYRGIHLLRRDAEEGVEFVTIMWFDARSAHYEVIQSPM